MHRLRRMTLVCVLILFLGLSTLLLGLVALELLLAWKAIGKLPRLITPSRFESPLSYE